MARLKVRFWQSRRIILLYFTSQVAADEALARRLAAEDERPADAWANAPAPPKDDGWARERERRRRRAGDDGPSEELREFSGERKGDDLDEIDI